MLKNQIKDKIHKARYILIVTHTNPDADTISCALTLSNYCYENRIKHKVFNSSKKLPRELNFLPKFDKITDQLPKFYDLIIYVDCADKKRVSIDFEKAPIINIDHHQSNDFFGDINIVDDSKASTAEVLYEILEKEEFNISKNMATCLYVGIYDDSIAFTTPRVNSKTFQIVNSLLELGVDPSDIASNLLQRDSLAKYRIMPKILDTLELHKEGAVATIYLEKEWLKQTGATPQECDEVVDMILKIAVVKIVCYFREIDGKIRVSLRSKIGYNVSNIATKFNGGGHINAAGCRFENVNIFEAKKILLENIGDIS